MSYTRKDRNVRYIRPQSESEKIRKLYPEITTQGYEKLVDINHIIKNFTQQQLQEINLREKHYGISKNMSLRDAFLEAQKLKGDFESLPAELKDHFKNDEFAFAEFIQKNHHRDDLEKNLYNLVHTARARDKRARETEELNKKQQETITPEPTPSDSERSAKGKLPKE